MKFSHDMKQVVGIDKDGKTVKLHIIEEGKSFDVTASIDSEQKFDKKKDFLDFFEDQVFVTLVKEDGANQVQVFQIVKQKESKEPPTLTRQVNTT